MQHFLDSMLRANSNCAVHSTTRNSFYFRSVLFHLFLSFVLPLLHLVKICKQTKHTKTHRSLYHMNQKHFFQAHNYIKRVTKVNKSNTEIYLNFSLLFRLWTLFLFSIIFSLVRYLLLLYFFFFPF